MADYAIIYDVTTGAQVGNYMGPDGTAAIQELPAGAAYMIVPVSAWKTPVDLAMVKAAICEQIEAGADQVAASIITLSPRKVQTSMAIKEESDRWTTGAASTDFPFLAALATANSTTIAQEKASFDASWAQAVPPGALINATSIAAQRRVMASTNLAEIAAASTIDWPTVMATLAHA
jgi:hypothetical protein